MLAVGAVATNVIGKRLLQRTEGYLLRVPVFRTIYAPVKQLVAAFSPDNEFGFKRVVHARGQAGLSLGFLTKEFTVDRGAGPRGPGGGLRADQSPLSGRHRDRRARPARLFPDITVEEGIRIFLTGGMALPSRLSRRRGDDA